MSWGVKYRSEAMDFNGHVWRTDILVENYTGAITEVGGAGVPVTINTLGEGDAEAGIKPKEWILEWNNVTSFQFMELFTGTARDYLMKLYKDDALVGTGWVDPDNYSEEFTCPVYPSIIHCHDGLGELKNISFSMPADPATYNRPVIWYLSQALLQTGLELYLLVGTDITFFSKSGDLYESRLFENIYIDWRVFRRGESEYFTWYEIVTYILNSLEGHRLFQEAGAWWLERAGVLKTIAGYNVDTYNENGVYKLSVERSDIKALTSGLVDLPVRFGSDAQLTVVPGWKKFRIVHEYGVKANILHSHNLDGNIYEDDWKTEYDLLYWNRVGIPIIKETNSFRIPGLTTLDPPFSYFIQSHTITISNADDIAKLRASWEAGDVMMRLSIDYTLKVNNYFPETETIKMYCRVVLVDNLGNVWNATNNYDYGGEHIVRQNAWFDQHPDDPGVVMEVIPAVNELATASFVISNPWLRGVPSPYVPTSWGFFVKIYPAVSSLDTGDYDLDGLVIHNVKLGWYDKNNEEGIRNINQFADSKNRYVPADIEVQFGETPGHWGSGADMAGQEFMDRFIYMDENGDPIITWGTISAGVGGGLINNTMRAALISKNKLPRFKLRGSVRDNLNSMDFTTVLQDYDGRNYIATGMSRDAGMCELQAEWIQIREPEQKLGGEFNWDFSNDFNIGT